MPKEQIAIKTSEINELKTSGCFLLPARCCYIITVNALKEGWIVRSPYILATLANRTSKVTWNKSSGVFFVCPMPVNTPVRY